MSGPGDASFNPYPGLRPFQTDEEYLFFGRERQRDELTALLQRNRFVAVLGASGSGKSSLVRAGLLPALYGGVMTRAGSHWSVAVMRPGGSPTANLAAALLEAGLGEGSEGGYSALDVETTLTRSALGLVEAVRQARLPEGGNLLVVVDQFEELFRFRHHPSSRTSRDEAAAFVSLLLEGVRQDAVSIYVVLTMRSDFFGDCSQFEDLAEAINAGEYLVPRLSREQKKQAIEGPARVGGGVIAPRLLQRLLNEVGDDPDQLPILQHALMRTWDHWSRGRAIPLGAASDKPIDIEDYEAIGGMHEALSRHADEAFEELGSDGLRILCERIFKALTERGPDNRGVRRPTRLEDLCAIVGAPVEEVREVVQAFRRAGRTFLMPMEPSELAPRTTVDISHESLMRVWQRLDRWVDEESRSARVYRRLADSAALHEEGKAGLYRDPDLQIALAWREKSAPNAAWADRYHDGFERAMRFLEASGAARSAEEEAREAVRQRELDQVKAVAAAEGRRAEEQARYSAMLKWLVRGLGLVAMFAVFALAFALISKKQAESSESVARESELLAQNEAERARKSERYARRISYFADMNLAQQALRSSNRGKSLRLLDRYRPAAGQEDLRGWEWRYLWEQTRGDELFALGPFDHHVFAIDFSPDGRLLAVGQFNGRVTIWDVAERKQIKQLVAPPGRYAVVKFSPDGRHLVSTHMDGKIHFWSVPSFEPEPSLPAGLGLGGNPVRSLAFSKDGTRFAAIGSWGVFGLRLLVWDVETRSQIASFPGGRGLTLHHGMAGLSPDGKTAYAGLSEGRLRAYDVDSQKEIFDIAAHEQGITALAVSPDGNRIVTGSGYSDGTIRVWNARTGAAEGVLEGHSTWVCWLAFSGDGKSLVSSSADQTVRLWNMADKTLATELRGHLGEVYTSALAPGGKTLASGCKDGTLFFWNAEAPRTRTTYAHRRVGSYFMDWTADSKSIVTRDVDGTVVLLDRVTLEITKRIETLGRLQGRTRTLCSPDGRHVIVDVDRGAAVYDLAEGRTVKTLEGMQGLKFMDSGKILITLARDARLVFLDTATWTEKEGMSAGGFRAVRTMVAAFDIAPDLQRIATGLPNGNIWILRPAPDGALPREGEIEAHKRALSDLKLSPDGRLLGTTSEDGTAYLWDTGTWNRRADLSGHLKGVHSIVFFRDGSRVATGSSDADAVKLWDTSTAQESLTLSAEGGGLMGFLSDSPDGNAIGGISSLGGNIQLHAWLAPSMDEIDRYEAGKR